MTATVHISNADIDATIVDVEYVVFTKTKIVSCALTLKNGYVVTGEGETSAIAYDSARSKIWQLEKYARMSQAVSQ